MWLVLSPVIRLSHCSYGLCCRTAASFRYCWFVAG